MLFQLLLWLIIEFELATYLYSHAMLEVHLQSDLHMVVFRDLVKKMNLEDVIPDV